MNRTARQVLYAALLLGTVTVVGMWITSYKPSVKPERPPEGLRDAGSLANRIDAEAEQPPPGPAVYLWPPFVNGSHEANGHYVTTVRFPKTDGPWAPSRESTFDLWFDGDVEQVFESRGFQHPVMYTLEKPEPRHLSIKVMSPPLAVTYVAFMFKSGHPVSLVRSDVSPKRNVARDGGDGG